MAAHLTARPTTFAVVCGSVTPTNLQLAEACWRRGLPARLMDPARAERELRAGDVALGRLDVRPTLDGVEPGLAVLARLAERGVRVLNSPESLLAAHDKAITARRLAVHRIPHPRTRRVDAGESPSRLATPVVLKPRFGSWGRDVYRCRDRAELHACLMTLRGLPWFARHGALAQELVPAQGRDLRVLVAGGEVVGAITRVAPPHEWRTSVALGARRERTEPPPEARALALAAAAAVGADLAGVDLLPVGRRRYVVLEVNGAVDLTGDYGLQGKDPFEQIVAALVRGHQPAAVGPAAAAPATGPAAATVAVSRSGR